MAKILTHLSILLLSTSKLAPKIILGAIFNYFLKPLAFPMQMSIIIVTRTGKEIPQASTWAGSRGVYPKVNLNQLKNLP